MAAPVQYTDPDFSDEWDEGLLAQLAEDEKEIQPYKSRAAPTLRSPPRLAPTPSPLPLPAGTVRLPPVAFERTDASTSSTTPPIRAVPSEYSLLPLSNGQEASQSAVEPNHVKTSKGKRVAAVVAKDPSGLGSNLKVQLSTRLDEEGVQSWECPISGCISAYAALPSVSRHLKGHLPKEKQEFYDSVAQGGPLPAFPPRSTLLPTEDASLIERRGPQRETNVKTQSESSLDLSRFD
jgi:hypothetical protein